VPEAMAHIFTARLF